MKKNMLLIDKKKIGLLVFMWICWFLPNYSINLSYQYEELKQGLLLILIIITSTICYYLISNSLCKIGVLIISLICVTLVLGLKVALTVYSSFGVIFLYCNSISKKTRIGYGKNTDLFFILIPVVVCFGGVLNVPSLISIEESREVFKPTFVGLLFIISFIFILQGCNKIVNLEKKQKKFYKNLYVITIIGILGSFTSIGEMLNYSVVFFSWLLFISILVLEDDITLETSAMMLIEKAQNFLK